ncbi:predicted protein [Postia placenta Mad-698-R]|nr:predicted protein [Postia placenta Mad-698-R]
MPPGSTHLLTGGKTPVRTKATQSASYMEGNLAAARRAVMKELGTTIPQVSTEFFQTHLLPPLPAGVGIDQVVRELRKGDYIKGNRWAAFSKDPKNVRGKENVCFKSLERVAAAIEEVTFKVTGEEPLLKFVRNPDGAPEYNSRTSKSRPDGCFIRKSGPKGKFRWMDIALSAEYKKVENAKTKDDLWQDVRKVIWSMHHCMREDARRRFTYGLTIENRTMRMWFCSRTELFVSKPIDFITAHHEVVHFFVAMMYAAEHEAGWDPTMRYVRKKNGKNDELELDKEDKPRLDIDVRDQNGTVVRYRTIRWLSDDGANDLRSRGTRVWEVCILDKNKEGVDRFALKDQWIDADRQREGMIIEQLRNANADKQTKDAIQQSILTVEHHGDVYVEDILDHTHSLMARDDVPPMHSGSKLQQIPEDEVEETTTTKLSKRTQAGVGNYQTPDELGTASAQKIETYHAKVHYRIVFKEVCKPLCDYTSLKDVFDILISGLVGLAALHELGWIHRDISTSNLLGIMVDGVLRCKLSDLEYAKLMDDHLGHEIRTGTRPFMAVEVYDLDYWFTSSKRQTAQAECCKPPPKPAASRLDRVDSMQRGNHEDIDELEDSDCIPTTPFRYNPLHDLESIWWVAIYFVFNKSVVKVGGKPPSMDTLQRGSYNAQKRYAELLITSPHDRLKALAHETALAKSITHLHAAMRKIAGGLIEIKKGLVNCYLEAGKQLDLIHHTVGQDLVDDVFITWFGYLLNALQKEDIEIDILRKDSRQEFENPFEIAQDKSDQESVAEDPARVTSTGITAAEATAKDGAQDVIVEDPDVGRSVDKATGPSVPQISTELLVEGRTTRSKRKRSVPVRYGAEFNVKKGMTSKTASSSAPTIATQAATSQSTSRTTSNAQATTKSRRKAKTKAKTKTK